MAFNPFPIYTGAELADEYEPRDTVYPLCSAEQAFLAAQEYHNNGYLISKGDKRNYAVAVSHPTGFHHGTHTLTVTLNTDGSRYVNGYHFGCSRDYRTDSDKVAVRFLLQEHATTLQSFRAV